MISSKFFYFNFKNTKNICYSIYFKYKGNSEKDKNLLINLLSNEQQELFDLIKENKNIIKYLIDIYCSTNEIDFKLLDDFLKKLLENNLYQRKLIIYHSLKIFQNSYFHNNNSKNLILSFTKNKLFFENYFNLIKNNFEKDLNNLYFINDNIIKKYFIIGNTALYDFIIRYKFFLNPNSKINKDNYEEFFKTNINPNLLYIKQYEKLMFNLIKIFSKSLDYEKYIESLLATNFYINDIINFNSHVTNSELSNDVKTFIKKYLDSGYIIKFFGENNERTNFWKNYKEKISNVEIINFNSSLKAYIIYLKDIVAVEFYPVGSLLFYKTSNIYILKKRPIIFPEQLRVKNLTIKTIRHSGSWQYNVEYFLSKSGI